MGYLVKSAVINAIHEDMDTTLMCYEDKETREIVRFCYESMECAIERMAQYRVDNVTEIEKEAADETTKETDKSK